MSEEQELAQMLLDKCRHLMCGNEMEACERIVEGGIDPDEEDIGEIEDEIEDLESDVKSLEDDLEEKEWDLEKARERLKEAQKSAETKPEDLSTLERMKTTYILYL